MKLCLDTNAYSVLLRPGDDPAAVSAKAFCQAAMEQASELSMPVVAYGELLAGFRSGTREQENRALLAEFLADFNVRILDVNSETAEWFSVLHQRLRMRGRPIPMNDLWIASITAQSGSQLLTLDAHFQELPEIVALVARA